MSSTTNLQNGDGWTHLNNLETLQNLQVDGNLTVLGTINGSESNNFVITPITTVGNGVLTAVGLTSGAILRSGPVAAYTDTTDTAAAIYAALGSPAVGTTADAIIKNATAFTQTIAAGTGVTLPLTIIVPAFSTAEYIITVNSATAVTFAHLVTNPIATGTAISAPAIGSLATVGAGVITATLINGSLIQRSGAQSNTAFSDTTDTAANIIAACAQLVGKIGTSMLIEYANSTNATATLVGGTGVTVSGTSVVPPNTIGQFLLTYTAAATLTMVGLGVTQSVATALTILGSSTGTTAIGTTNSGTTNFTVNAPAFNETMLVGGIARCTATSTYTSSTALTIPTGLSIALQAAGVYRIRGQLQGTSAAVGGITAQLTATNSLSLTSANVSAWNYNGTTLNALTNITALASDMANSANQYTNLFFDGTIVVNAAGTINVSTAQHTSNGTPTTVVAGSYFEVVRIA